MHTNSIITALPTNHEAQTLKLNKRDCKYRPVLHEQNCDRVILEGVCTSYVDCALLYSFFLT